MSNALCFVLMPFGIKSTQQGTWVDFDAVYQQLIKPAIEDAGMQPIRADEEKYGGVIDKAMYERLLLCDYAVADLTTANANVFYELGIRHAHRRASTTLLFAQKSDDTSCANLPFDVNSLRALPYQLDSHGKPLNPARNKAALTQQLQHCRAQANEDVKDSPLFQLLQDYPDIQHRKTDVFREQARYSESLKEQFAQARALSNKAQATEQLKQLQHTFSNLAEVEPGVLIDLMLSYRAVEAWDCMINLIEHLPELLAQTVMVQEQYGFALNRDGNSDKAERVLKAVIKRYGPSSETFGILGRVYKDRWQAAQSAGEDVQAKRFLTKAINSYLDGFNSDWRDAYPGVNAVTLMEAMDPPDPRRDQLLPVVRYAVERKIESGSGDFWDHMTLAELAVIGSDPGAAQAHLDDAISCDYENWNPKSTAKNFDIIYQKRHARGQQVEWLKELVEQLKALDV
ncbi:TRAFs-binding domain-containing protein [Pseudoalteromonas sp. R3]|uniref:TRAFs-binding domain-containing protein n=1 Tax=Pseudoalteromonas sp. R3 TaxID=1709477 RepID=UPI0006B5032C|nr:TRAFs-binding domain-containing protein [Pseudoalteromonas sp. R3]AZZ99439.1 DUF4071 domain-containing protein [Pseudoalteromonas sp. R3]